MRTETGKYIIIPVIELQHQMDDTPEFLHNFDHFVLCEQGGSCKIMKSIDFYKLSVNDICNATADGYITILPADNMFISDDIIIGINSMYFWSNNKAVLLRPDVMGTVKLYVDGRGNPVIHVGNNINYGGPYSVYEGCRNLHGNTIKKCTRQQLLRSVI